MEAREPARVSSSQPPLAMAGPTSFSVGASPPAPAAPSSAGIVQGMRLSFDPMASSAPYPGDGVVPGIRQSSVFDMGEPIKKKRGRPRKYAPDGSMALALTPLSSASGYSNSPASDPASKRRGRPLGSGKKQQLQALGSSGVAFTPHVITVKPGEDVASRIMAFSQQGPRTVCVLSANGAVCNITLRQPATSGGLVTYEGRFEIISLSGSFLLTEDDDTRRTGGLSVALAGSDGRILGGCVAGMLMAATPVQVVVGSFIAEGKKPKPTPLKREPLSAPPQITGFTGSALAVRPPSEGTSSESSDDPGSPVNHCGASCNNPGQHVQPPYATIGWSLAPNQSRHESDIKMMSN